MLLIAASGGEQAKITVSVRSRSLWVSVSADEQDWGSDKRFNHVWIKPYLHIIMTNSYAASYVTAADINLLQSSAGVSSG